MLFTRKVARRSGRIGVIGCSLAAFGAVLAASGGARLEERSSVVLEADAGPFHLFAIPEPARLAWHWKGRVLVAERLRAGRAALQTRSPAGWSSIGPLRRAAAVEGRVAFEAPASEGGLVRVEAAAVRRDSREILRVEVEARGAIAIRDDWIPGPEEQVYIARGRPAWVFSSKGYAVTVEGAGESTPRVEQPDPDTLRLEATGERLTYEVLPGSVREVLAEHLRTAISRRDARAAGDPAGAATLVPVRTWTDLDPGLAWILEAFLSSGEPAALEMEPLVEDAALRERVEVAAAFLPWFERRRPEARSARSRAIADAVRRAAGGRLETFAADGLPLFRPLFAEHPEPKPAWTSRGEWLLGPDLLVAPVTEKGVRERRLWIPPGEWVDLCAEPAAADLEYGPSRKVAGAGRDGIVVYARRSAASAFADLGAVLRSQE